MVAESSMAAIAGVRVLVLIGSSPATTKLH
jgi:hypothetical protein